MSSEEAWVEIETDLADELRGWVSLWADLLHVDMTLHAREKIAATAPNLFIRRALWEAAVIAYGRTAGSGRRQQRVTELLDLLGSRAQTFHDEVMEWRNWHVAHRVDESREETSALAVLDARAKTVKKVLIRVAPDLGPEEEQTELVARFKKYVKQLRDAAWEQRIAPLQRNLLDEVPSKIDQHLARAQPSPPPKSSSLTIEVDPSGGQPSD